jgi:RND family efflux transporter MFP subunit
VRHPEKRQLTDFEEFNGWLEPDRMVEVRARVRGHIMKVNFTDGEIVKKGQTLFVLDPREFDATIGRAEDKVAVYQAKYVAAQKEADRTRRLYNMKSAPLQDVEKADADAKALKSEVSAAKNEVKRAKVEKDYSIIKAEITGRISRAQLTEGNLVNAGGSDPLLTTIVSIDPIRVYFNVDERSLLRYSKNLGVQGKNLTDVLTNMKSTKHPFTFARDGETEFTHRGTLTFGDNRIDPTTGTLQIYGTIENKDGQLVPGARVRVRLPIGKPYPALLVPETAILTDQNERYVLIADAKNVIRRRNVTLGRLTDDRMRAIKPADKLPQGEEPEKWWVAVDNLQRARLNYPIDPQKPRQSSPVEKLTP